MKHQYESEILFRLMERDGFNIPSSVPPYEAEIKAYLIEQVKLAYPKLNDYEAEWLLYNYTKHLPADFPISSVSNVTKASFENVVPFAYQSAILKGHTLVNLQEKGKWKINDDNAYYSPRHKASLIKTNTKYIIYFTNLPSTAIACHFEYGESKRKDILDNRYSIFTTGTNISRNYYIHIYPITGGSFTAEELANCHVMIIEYQDGMENWDIPYFEGMQSVQMPVLTTSNEDGTKTNILTVNEDVTLRGVGDVKDELNCLTGELTQRIGKKIFENNKTYRVAIDANTPNIIHVELDYDANEYQINQRGGTNPLADVIPNNPINRFSDDKEGVYVDGNGYLILCLSREKAKTQEEFGVWLQQNPITIQYKLATDSIKTVDLTITNQDGETLNKLKPFEGTMHFSTSGENIRPLFSGEIPVEAITQNLASFIGEE